MAPKPTVDENRVRQLLTTEEGKRRTASDVAALLTRELTEREKPVNPVLIRSLIHRRTWDLPPAKPGRPLIMEYLVDEILGPFEPEHSDLTTLHKLRRWERIQAGKASEEGKHGQAAVNYVNRLLRAGEVTTYGSQAGFSTRCAYPWEFGSHFALPEPRSALDQIRKWLTGYSKGETAIPDHSVILTGDHAQLWKSWLADRE